MVTTVPMRLLVQICALIMACAEMANASVRLDTVATTVHSLFSKSNEAMKLRMEHRWAAVQITAPGMECV